MDFKPKDMPEFNENNVHASHEHVSHSHHHSSSHHSRHHSSHHEKHEGFERKSLLDRIQKKIDARFSRKSIMAMSLLVILVLLLLIGLIYVGETWGANTVLPDTDSNGSISVGKETPQYSLESAPLVIPPYWENMVEEKTKKVKALQSAGGKDCISFAWASDTHIPDNENGRTNDLGKVMSKMLDNCEIPFAILSGDIGTRASYETEEAFLKAQQKISQHLAPLWGTERLLVALGNHDGCYGDSDSPYQKQVSAERLWEMYFRGQALDLRRVFSDDGLYFYVDNKAQKTRFIILNSQFGGKYLVDGNGWAVNNRFATSCYGQKQLDWLADEALDMPAGYGAVIVTHVPPKVLGNNSAPYTVDSAQLCGIINAYNSKNKFSGSYTSGVDGWTNSKVNVNFENAKGEIIALFAGHVHQDTIDTATLSCPLITIISSGASVNFGEAPARTPGSDTETSFDVVTINRKTRTIYCTRVGAGQDRIVQY